MVSAVASRSRSFRNLHGTTSRLMSNAPVSERTRYVFSLKGAVVLFKRGESFLAPWVCLPSVCGRFFPGVLGLWAPLAFGPVVLFRWRVLSSGPVVLGFVLGHCFFLVSFCDQPRGERALRGGRLSKVGRRPKERGIPSSLGVHTFGTLCQWYWPCELGTYFGSVSLLIVFPPRLLTPSRVFQWYGLFEIFKCVGDGGSDAHCPKVTPSAPCRRAWYMLGRV